MAKKEEMLAAEPRSAKTWETGEIITAEGLNALEIKAENALTTAQDAKTKAEAACPKTQKASKSGLGLVKQSAAVPEAAGENVTKAEFKALLGALKAAEIMANS